MAIRLAKLEKAQRRRPELPLFARLADQYLRRGMTCKALDLCQQGCERFPEYPSGHLVLSRCHEAQEDLRAARAALDHALRLDQENPAAFKRLSAIHERLGNTDLACEALQQAGRLDPLDEQIIRRLDEFDYAQRRETVHPAPVAYDELPGETDILTAERRQPVLPAPHRGDSDPPAAEPPTEDRPTDRADQPADLEDAPPADSAAEETETAPVEPPAAISVSAPSKEAATDTDTAAPEEPAREPLETPAVHAAADVPAGQADGKAAASAEGIASLGADLFGDGSPSAPAVGATADAAPSAPAEPEADPESGLQDGGPRRSPSSSAEPTSTESAHGVSLRDLETLASPSAAESDATEPVDALSALDPRDDAELVRALEEIEVAPEPEEVAPEPEPESGAGVDPEPEPLGSGQTLPSVSIEPNVAAAATVAEEEGTESAAPPIATATLAEIYCLQGIPQRAVKIYQQLLLRDPDNEDLKLRLAELRRQGGAGDTPRQQEAH